MIRLAKVIACAALVLEIGGVSGCGDDDPAAPQPEFSFEPVMSELWPHEDGNIWIFSASRSRRELPGTGLYASPEDVPPLPAFSELYSSLHAAQDVGYHEAGSLTLQFAGEHSSQPGVQILRATRAGIFDVPVAFVSDSGETMWKLEDTRVAGYNLDYIGNGTTPDWIFLTSDLAPGDGFVHDVLQGWYTLEGRVWRHLQMPWNGNVINCVEMVYLLDAGIQTYIDDAGNVLGFHRRYIYGRVVYGQSVGPMAWREKAVLAPAGATLDSRASILDLKMDLQSAERVAPRSMSIGVRPLPEE